MAPPRYSPNAEWADWLQEEGDRKLAQGSKSADTFFRASKALRKHDQLLIHPSEAKVISGIGTTCIGIVTSRLRQKCQQTGDPFPAEPPRRKRKQSTQNSGSGPAKRTKSTGPRRVRPTEGLTEDLRIYEPDYNAEIAGVDLLGPTGSQTAPYTPSCSRFTGPTDTGPSESGPQAGSSQAQPKSPSKRPAGGLTAKARTEGYCPKPRTGGWGILVGLYILSNEEIKPYTKLEIIAWAQKHCNSSYTDTAAKGGGAGNSGYYTAWKNIDKLMEEGYVKYMGGRPQKFMITQQGYEVGSVLANIEKLPPVVIDTSKLHIGFKTPAATPQSQDLTPNPQPLKAQKSVDVRPTTNSRASSKRFAARSALDAQGDQSTIPLPAKKSSAFEFWYLDSANLRVVNPDAADTSMHHETFETLYKVLFSQSQNSHPFKRTSIINEKPMPIAPVTGSEEALMIGWMREAKIIPKCPGISATRSASNVSPGSGYCSPLIASGSTIRATSSITSNESSFTIKDGFCSSGESKRSASIAPEEADRRARANAAEARRHDTQRQKTRKQEARAQEGRTQKTQTQEAQMHQTRRLNAWSPQPTLFRIDSSASPAPMPTDEVVHMGDWLEDEEPASNPTLSCSNEFVSRTTALADVRSTLSTRRTNSILRTHSSASTIISNSNCATYESRPEVWQAGTYDICLLLDHREVRSAGDREGFYNLCCEKAALAHNPVQVLQRDLVLGDALWIAVRQDDEREMVLDSIVERKRLDDLCSSVVDRRFEEQKARLRRSGLRDPIYLVEMYNKQTNLEANGQMIYTSKAEVMVLNKFQLEETSDWKASVDYLIRRTEVLRAIHQMVDLWIIPGKVDRSTYLEELSELRKLNPSRYWVTSYSDFEKLNHKSSNLTVKELWARMINALPGMSPEKVISFVERWTTPRKFWDECQMRLKEDAESQQDGGGRNPWQWIEKKFAGDFRAIGPALSKRIWELYNLSEYRHD